MITALIYFILACLALILSSGTLVKSLNKIAKFFGISTFAAAFIIMAFSTSLPELFVGISSALAKNPSLSLGNILGASIIDITLIAGIIILASREIIFGTKKIKQDINYESSFVFGSVILLPLLFLIGSSLSRIDGIILVSFFAFNVFRTMRKKEKHKEKLKKDIRLKSFLISCFVFLLALSILFLSSNYAVKYASQIAIELQLPQILIGLFLLSFATTLPELVFGVSAARLKYGEMGIGNQTGSIFVNLTLIPGIVSIISPIRTSTIPFISSSIFLLLSTLLFIAFAKSSRKFERLEGISLILLYVVFIIIQYILFLR